MSVKYPSIVDLVPHGLPIRMLDALEDWSEGFARCSMRVKEGTPFLRDGRVDTLVGIEIMAQAVAACLGYEAFQSGAGVRVGMIIASRRFDLHEPYIAEGETLQVHVKRQRGNEDLSHFQGEIWSEDRNIASAHMTVYHAEKPPA